MTREIRLSIGGICVGLLPRNGMDSGRMEADYGPFLSSDQPSLVLDLAVEERDWPIPAKPGDWPLSITSSGSLLHVESLGEEATVDFARGKGRVAMAPDIPGENSLRVIFAWLCLSKGSLLVHSSGVVRDGRGYIFFGKSGAGKTTVANLSLGHTILSDDLVMVRRINGSFHAQGVPFRGSGVEVPLANTHAPLAGVFRLIKDDRNYVETVNRAGILATLLTSVPFLTKDQVAGQYVADFCARMLSAVPSGQLHFREDGGFWEVLPDV